jgi:hypothetical protein
LETHAKLRHLGDDSAVQYEFLADVNKGSRSDLKLPWYVRLLFCVSMKKLFCCILVEDRFLKLEHELIFVVVLAHCIASLARRQGG